MCKKAVVWQEVKHNNNRNKGVEDNSYNIFNLHVSSVGMGIGILIILIILYKITWHSNVKNWSKLLQCLFPCCRQTWSQPQEEQRDTDITHKIPLNCLHHRRRDGNHSLTCEVPREPYIYMSSGKEGQSAGQTMWQDGPHKSVHSQAKRLHAFQLQP